MFAIAAILYLPDGLIRRPTQILWKAVTGFALLYSIILTFFVFMTPDQTQNILKTFIDSSLGVPLS